MPRVGFEPTVAAFECAETFHVLECGQCDRPYIYIAYRWMFWSDIEVDWKLMLRRIVKKLHGVNTGTSGGILWVAINQQLCTE
jgi:hypothetical protein